MSYVIIFKDRGHKTITDEQEKAIMMASGSGNLGLKIDGQFVSFSSISRIPTSEDFYRDFPEKRPEEIRDTFGTLYLPIARSEGNKQIRSDEGKKRMLEGYRGYFEEKGLSKEEVDEKVRLFLAA